MILEMRKEFKGRKWLKRNQIKTSGFSDYCSKPRIIPVKGE
jgi:hypothetical protein